MTTAIAAGCGSATHPDEPAAAPPVRVTVSTAAERELPSAFEAGGVVRARSTALVASRILAPIAAVHVRPGDRVRRGAPLVTLDSREMRATSAQAAAALAAGTEAARAADFEIRAADSNVRLARASHERIRALHDKRAATPQELDVAVAALEAAEAQLAGARARAASAAGARDAAHAAAEASRISTSYTVLSAPFDAVVSERQADPGSMAVPGVALLTIEDPSAFRIEVQLDESRAATLAVGQSAEVRIDSAAAGNWQPGTIGEIARVDPASHSFLVKIDLPGRPSVRSGLFGRVRFKGPSRRALAVPKTSVVRRGQLTYVFAIDRDSTAKLRPVLTAGPDGDLIEVLAGLGTGERIVVDPPPALTDGARVEATAAAEGETGARR
jgi:multidrug efflux pump subunit AcrA (membrane-fusion protein)